MTAFNTVLVTVGVDQSPADLAPPEGNVIAVPSGTEWPDTNQNPVVPMVVKGTVGDGVNGGTSSNAIINLIASDNFSAGVLTWNFIINIRGISTINVADVPVKFSLGASQSVWTILAAAGWTPTHT